MDEPELVRRSQQGDGSAFAGLFEQYYARSYRVAYSIARNRALAEDIVQEAFMQAFRSIHSIRPGAPFGPWFYQVVIRTGRRITRPRKLLFVSLDAWKARGTEPRDSAAEGALDSTLLREQVWRGLGELSEAHREVLVLRYLADLTDEQVAQAVEAPLGTVKSRLHHARQKLTEVLRRDGLIPQVQGALSAVLTD